MTYGSSTSHPPILTPVGFSTLAYSSSKQIIVPRTFSLPQVKLTPRSLNGLHRTSGHHVFLGASCTYEGAAPTKDPVVARIAVNESGDRMLEVVLVVRRAIDYLKRSRVECNDMLSKVLRVLLNVQ